MTISEPNTETTTNYSRRTATQVEEAFKRFKALEEFFHATHETAPDEASKAITDKMDAFGWEIIEAPAAHIADILDKFRVVEANVLVEHPLRADEPEEERAGHQRILAALRRDLDRLYPVSAA